MLADCAAAPQHTLGQALEARGGFAPGLNTIRIGLAFAVLVSHSFDLVGDGVSEPFRAFSGGQTSLGGTAVYIFFLLSGFLVTPSLLRSKSLGEYAIKRAARILPALAVVVAFAALLLGPLLTTLPMSDYLTHPQLRDYLLQMIVLGGGKLPGVLEGLPAEGLVNGSLWTLRYETICYILLALAGLCGLLAPSRLILIAIAVLIALGWWAKGRHIYTFVPLGVEFPYILRFVAYFAAGVMMYIFRSRIVLNWKLAAGALVLTVIFLRFGFYHMFFPLLGGYIVLFLGMQERMGLAAMNGRDYSYGFYIYAFPIQLLAASFGPPQQAWWINVLLSAPPTLLCAILSWHLIEKPSLALVRKANGFSDASVAQSPSPEAVKRGTTGLG